MDFGKLNHLIKTAQKISDEQLNGTMDPKLNKQLNEYLLEIKAQYGSFLLDKLFDIYDDYFSDDEIKPLEQYLITDGVEVEGDELDELKSKLVIKPYPLRFEVIGMHKKNHHVIWQDKAVA